MGKVLNIVVGFIGGIILTGVIGWNAMPGMMLNEKVSPYGLDETVAKIKENALAKGWIVKSIKAPHKSVKKFSNKDVLPIKLINICQADALYNILNDDKSRVVSVFIPCTISVYERADGKIYISSMNASLLGKMFGGIVSTVMGKVAIDQASFIDFAS